MPGFVAALPSEITIGVEVPLQDLREAGIGPAERARRAVEASRRSLYEDSGFRALMRSTPWETTVAAL